LSPGFAVVVASDKLFYWLFQNQPDRILALLPDLPGDACGYRFSAPVLKEREYRLDGLFLPPPERPELPAVILEAQMAADGGFLRRLFAECARLVQQEPSIHQWRVVVLCPSRQLHFGDPAPVAEFVEHRVRWIELLPAVANPTGPALVQALALLVQSEQELPASSAALRARVADTNRAAEIDDVIVAILVARFSGRSIQELCAMGGITLDDFTQSVAYREIFGRGRQEGRQEGHQQGRQEGRQEGWQEGELDLALRLLQRRCGQLAPQQERRVRALPSHLLEALAEALLDFEGMADLNAWLAANG
jgi:predicted transposase YdaD